MSDPEPQRAKRDRAALKRQALNPNHWTALGLVVTALAAAGVLIFTPLWGPLLLGAWSAHIAWPLYQKLAKAIRQRESAAAVLTVTLVIALLAPLVLAALSLSNAAVDLGHKLLESDTGSEALRALAGSDESDGFDISALNWQQWLELLQRHGRDALGAANLFFGALATLFIGLVVFVAAFFTFLVDGARSYAWLLDRSPLDRGHTHRLASAFTETGHGLIVGVGLTALIQGAVATVGYLVTGVPRAFVLGLVTACASLIPSVGSGLVWTPVALGLAMSGRSGAAIALLIIGCLVSTVDNLLRPLLMQYGNLKLHGLVLFVAMLGGIAVFGGAGLLLGPLLVRLASEGLTMLKEHRAQLSE
jgi:predicted PurR-regulated permease PerM